ncbi:Glutathione synthetase [Coemansia sp. BCRC 34962]|nr:Glutathione synthetase [Coemansia sp. BCRC 34962]
MTQTNTGFLSARPQYTQRVSQLLVDEAVDWEATHGLLLRAPKTDGLGFVPAPVALGPSPIPRREFDKVVMLQPVFNLLFDRVSRDHEFLTSTLESLGSSDEFTLRTLAMYTRQRLLGVWKPGVIGIHRSDYLIHAPGDEPKASPLAKQVEFNTIASSFASLSSIVGDFHRFMLAKTEYKDLLQSGTITKEQLPTNESLTSIGDGIAAGFELYGNPGAVVAMVVQPNERNIYDQRWIHVVRLTFGDIVDRCVIGKDNRLFMGDKEIAVAYYRSGYAPTDFPSEKEWDAVERFIDDEQTAELVRECFVGLYPLDNSSEGQKAYDLAMANPSNYVVKPQREGGGYNTYGDDIPKLLSSLSNEERKGYILMDLIRAPGFNNILLRNGQLVASEVVSELGIYGVWVSDGDGNIVINRSGGHLLRTKASDVYEGGVAAGFAVIDSPLLI